MDLHHKFLLFFPNEHPLLNSLLETIFGECHVVWFHKRCARPLAEQVRCPKLLRKQWTAGTQLPLFERVHARLHRKATSEFQVLFLRCNIFGLNSVVPFERLRDDSFGNLVLVRQHLQKLVH